LWAPVELDLPGSEGSVGAMEGMQDDWMASDVSGSMVRILGFAVICGAPCEGVSRPAKAVRQGEPRNGIRTWWTSDNCPAGFAEVGLMKERFGDRAFCRQCFDRKTRGRACRLLIRRREHCRPCGARQDRREGTAGSGEAAQIPAGKITTALGTVPAGSAEDQGELEGSEEDMPLRLRPTLLPGFAQVFL
jgi:hypothetical protein